MITHFPEAGCSWEGCVSKLALSEMHYAVPYGGCRNTLPYCPGYSADIMFLLYELAHWGLGNPIPIPQRWGRQRNV